VYPISWLLSFFRRVLDITPTHANTLYNYAVLLDTHLLRKSEAEQYYRRALEVEPRHAYALYNLAVLLEEKYANSDIYKEITDESQRLAIMDKRQEVCALYQRAAEADQKDATTLADYARYIFVRLDNATVAEPMFVAALKLDPGCEVALYHLALVFYKDNRDIDRAEVLIRELLKVAPQHANGMLTLARLLADSGQKATKSAKKDHQLEEAAAVYERAVPLSKEPALVATEYLRFAANSGSNKVKLAAIKSMGTYTSGSPKAPSGSNDAVGMCQSLLEELKTSIK
jgi:tetratricopeptide (TPR) repeat protein